jgi:ATP-dependent helicase HrpA/adenine-specific DNA-methyltransferase
MTEPEIILWSRIKNKQILGLKFRRQHSIGPYIVDFYCPDIRLAIEIDGGQHNQEENIIYDEERTTYLNSLNIKVVRYWNNEVLKEINNVIEDLINKIKNEGSQVYGKIV